MDKTILIERYKAAINRLDEENKALRKEVKRLREEEPKLWAAKDTLFCGNKPIGKIKRDSLAIVFTDVNCSEGYEEGPEIQLGSGCYQAVWDAYRAGMLEFEN